MSAGSSGSSSSVTLCSAWLGAALGFAGLLAQLGPPCSSLDVSVYRYPDSGFDTSCGVDASFAVVYTSNSHHQRCGGGCPAGLKGKPITLRGQIDMLAFCVFEVCVGIFWPSMMTMRATYVPEELRATIINMFRIPLNAFVCIVLANVSAVWLGSLQQEPNGIAACVQAFLNMQQVAKTPIIKSFRCLTRSDVMSIT